MHTERTNLLIALRRWRNWMWNINEYARKSRVFLLYDSGIKCLEVCCCLRVKSWDVAFYHVLPRFFWLCVEWQGAIRHLWLPFLVSSTVVSNYRVYLEWRTTKKPPLTSSKRININRISERTEEKCGFWFVLKVSFTRVIYKSIRLSYKAVRAADKAV